MMVQLNNKKLSFLIICLCLVGVLFIYNFYNNISQNTLLVGSYNLPEVDGPGTWISFDINNNKYFYYFLSNNSYQGSVGNIEQVKKLEYLITTGELKNSTVKIKGAEEIYIYTPEGDKILGIKIDNNYVEIHQ